MSIIFEKSVKGQRGYLNPSMDVSEAKDIEDQYLRAEDAQLPELSELEVVRHFSSLSQKNFGVDTHFYPLGSCTMKYNPKFTEDISRMPGFTNVHPLLPQLKNGEQFTQGCLQVLYDMDRLLSEITGMSAFTMQPLAGAHGELTGVMIMAAYHKARGNKKKYIIVPDASHGTNPATAAIAGYEILCVPSDENGIIDLAKLEEMVTDEVAGLMLTCPNTHGIFNSQITRISEMIHKVDGLMYYDGANLNAILGRVRPGDVGFDIVHINIHKTFSTPHGGGGPGSGPVGVKEQLVRFLPISRVEKDADGQFQLNYQHEDSIGYIASFYGNFGVILKAYAYIVMMGAEGLKEISNQAVLNANYIKEKLKDFYELAYDRLCMHECVFSAVRQAKNGVHAIDIAKFLIDQGFHPPTVYFPLTVREAMMIEPTETESKAAIDAFIEAMVLADKHSKEHPQSFADMPVSTPVCRPDEVKAAREMQTNYFPEI